MARRASRTGFNLYLRTEKARRFDGLKQGFTIVELLIVIVVISILAAITVAAFNGVQGRAHDSAIQSDLRQIAQVLEIYKAEHGQYPTPQNTAMAPLGLSATKSAYSDAGLNGSRINMIYCHTNNGAGAMTLIAISKSGSAYKYLNGVTSYTGRTDNSNTWIWCSDAGAPISEALDTERTILRTASGWASWIR